MLPGLVRTNNIREIHFSRNPKIFEFLHEYEYVKEFGEGVDRMFREMEAAGLPAPEYRTVEFMVYATLKNQKWGGAHVAFRDVSQDAPPRYPPIYPSRYPQDFCALRFQRRQGYCLTARFRVARGKCSVFGAVRQKAFPEKVFKASFGCRKAKDDDSGEVEQSESEVCQSVEIFYKL